MPTPQQFPRISQDANFREDASIYADHAYRQLRATDIRLAIESAFLHGGDAAFHQGYRLGQQHAQAGKSMM